VAKGISTTILRQVPRLDEGLVLFFIAALGVINLPMPLTGDQALFTMFGQELDAGAVLYRDLWDIKQPGIYLFYCGAGKLFGFNEVGIHLAELLFLLLFSFVLMRTSRAYLKHRAASLALPVFAVAIYYMVASALELTQVESLVGFPIYLVFWFSLVHPNAILSRTSAFMAGLMGAVVVSLKMFFAPIVVVFWLAAALRHLRGEGRMRVRESIRFLVWLAIGFLLPVAWFLLDAYTSNTLGLIWWTYFVYPGQVYGILPFSGAHMISSVSWFAGSYATVIVLATMAVITAVQRRGDGALFIVVCLWLGMSVILVVLEFWWWKYHLLLMVMPLSLLAAIGLDATLGFRRLPGVMVAILALCCVYPAAIGLASKIVTLGHHGWAKTAEDRIAFQTVVHRRYARLRPEVEFLRTYVSNGGGVYVFGDPTLLYLAGRRSAIAINGWTSESWSPELWGMAHSQLLEARPELIFVRSKEQRLIKRNGLVIQRMLQNDYEKIHSSRHGSWYRLD